ncbi:hypothetical protein D3C87_1398650 [compost metagenome]
MRLLSKIAGTFSCVRITGRETTFARLVRSRAMTWATNEAPSRVVAEPAFSDMVNVPLDFNAPCQLIPS